MARKGSGDSGEQILLLLKERAEATNLALNPVTLLSETYIPLHLIAPSVSKFQR